MNYERKRKQRTVGKFEINMIFSFCSESRMELGRKWEEINKDILVNVLGRVGMESLVLDIPFVCKAWYKASTEPHCWEHLIFPTYIKPDDIDCTYEWEEDIPDKGFAKRLAMKYQENLSLTAFVKFIVNRSCGNATIIELPAGCTREALEYVANE